LPGRSTIRRVTTEFATTLHEFPSASLWP
jgi:hypothetical protein